MSWLLLSLKWFWCTNTLIEIEKCKRENSSNGKQNVRRYIFTSSPHWITDSECYLHPFSHFSHANLFFTNLTAGFIVFRTANVSACSHEMRSHEEVHSSVGCGNLNKILLYLVCHNFISRSACMRQITEKKVCSRSVILTVMLPPAGNYENAGLKHLQSFLCLSVLLIDNHYSIYW